MRKLTLLLSALLLASLHGWADENDAILFKDAAVEKICVDNWDTNGDGKLSYAEAAAVTSLDEKFKNNEEIVTFNEFQYFTGVKKLKYDFCCAISLTEITMPSSMEVIGNYSFEDCAELTSVVLNEGLQKIGDSGFANCEKLESITLPESLTEFDQYCFSHCFNLKGITIPSKVKIIPYSAFCYCPSLKEATLGDGVEEIEALAFAQCDSLASFNITKNVNLIEDKAFAGCLELKNFTVDAENVNLTAPDGNIYSKDMKKFVAYAPGRTDAVYKIKDGVETVCGGAFEASDKIIKVVFPESTDSIGNGVFERCGNLESVVLPKGLKKISYYAFAYCFSLKNVNIPAQLSEIGESAFTSCGSLKTISLPESLVKIGDYAFIGCDNLMDVYVYSKTGDIEGLDNSELVSFGRGVTVYVPAGCVDVYKAHSYWRNAAEIKEIPAPEVITFKDAKVEAICVANWDADGDGKLSKDEAAAVTSLEGKFSENNNIENFDEFQYFTGVTATAENEFLTTGLKSITLPAGMKELGGATFRECFQLKNVTFNEGLEKVGARCFFRSSIENIDLPDNVSEIGESAFGFSKIKEFKVPANTTALPKSMFESSVLLENVIMHDNVKSCDSYAFNNCISLKSLHLGKSFETLGYMAFSGCKSIAEITVDEENQWFVSSDNVLFTKDMKTLEMYCPASAGTEYTVPTGVETISLDAFANSALKNIIIPQSVTFIGISAFNNCLNLESIELPDHIRALNKSLFNGCTNLKSVKLPSALSDIQSKAFFDCSSLEKIVLPESLGEMGSFCFTGCTNLNDIVCYSKTGNIKFLDKSDLIPEDENMRVVYVPYGCKAAYEAHPYWSMAHEIIEMEKPVIAFEDAEVEKICVANWDTDGDGKLSMDEAAAVTSLGGELKENVEIKSFNEFKYFTGVTATNKYEFYGDGLVSITMPESMKVLGKYTFADCHNLKNVVLNDSLETIGDDCFFNTAIESIDVPDCVDSIGISAFASCYYLKSFKMPANCNVVSDSMLDQCFSLDSLTLHDNVTSIGNNAFRSTSIKTFHIGKKLQSINSPFTACSFLKEFTIDADNQWFAFKDNALYSKDGKTMYAYCIGSKGREYTVPDGVEVLESNVFNSSLLNKIILPESLTAIGNHAFESSSALESIVLPEGVTKIGSNTFEFCENLKSVTFSSKMNSIEGRAFSRCGKLEKIVLPETLTTLGDNTFKGCDNLNEIVSYSVTGVINELENSGLIPEGENMRTVYVPAGCKSVYEADPYWANAHEIIEMQPTDIDQVNGTETITINGVKMDVNGTADIYSVEGVLVKHISAEDKVINLPAGVYVINGKKIVVR